MERFSGIRAFQIVLGICTLVAAIAAGVLLLLFAIAAIAMHNLQERYDGVSPWLYLIWALVSAVGAVQCWAYRDLLDIAVYLVEQSESQNKLLTETKNEWRQAQAHNQAQGELLADIEAELRRHHAAVESRK
jgi:hypothetical protein